MPYDSNSNDRRRTTNDDDDYVSVVYLALNACVRACVPYTLYIYMYARTVRPARKLSGKVIPMQTACDI